MLSLTNKNDNDLMEDPKTLFCDASIPPGISSIQWPPYSDVIAFIFFINPQKSKLISF
jgi:hypothetical protein